MATQPNQIENTDWLCMEGIRLLENGLEVLPCFTRDFEDNLEMEFPVGATFRVPMPNLGTIRSGTLAYNPAPIIDRHTTVTCDQIVGWDVEWDGLEQALSMPRGEDRIKKKLLVPAVKQIKQQWDSLAAAFATDYTSNIVGVLGTAPADFDAVYGAADERLTQLGANTQGGKTMLLPPSTARSLRKSAVSYFNPGSEISRMWKTGYIGEVTGFGDTFQSMSLYQHTSGVWAGTVEILTGSQSGPSLVLTATDGDTFIPRDRFNIAGVYDVNPMTLRSTGTLKQFVVIGPATVTAASSTATIQIYPPIVGPGSPYQNVSALPAAGADLTMFPGTAAPTSAHTGTIGLAMSPEAYAFVGIKLKNPKASSVEIVSQEQDPDTGLALAFVRTFDPVNRKWINRFDSVGGFGVLWGDHAAVAVLGV